MQKDELDLLKIVRQVNAKRRGDNGGIGKAELLKRLRLSNAPMPVEVPSRFFQISDKLSNLA
jgi:hypothetical protein